VPVNKQRTSRSCTAMSHTISCHLNYDLDPHVSKVHLTRQPTAFEGPADLLQDARGRSGAASAIAATVRAKADAERCCYEQHWRHHVFASNTAVAAPTSPQCCHSTSVSFKLCCCVLQLQNEEQEKLDVISNNILLTSVPLQTLLLFPASAG
jgi:hypothetical protein